MEIVVISFCLGYLVCFWERRREIRLYHKEGIAARQARKELIARLGKMKIPSVGLAASWPQQLPRKAVGNDAKINSERES